MAKRKKRRKRRKKKNNKTISIHEIIANLRSNVHRPTRAHQNKKAKINKNACRNKEVTHDGSSTDSRLFILASVMRKMNNLVKGADGKFPGLTNQVNNQILFCGVPIKLTFVNFIGKKYYIKKLSSSYVKLKNTF